MCFDVRGEGLLFKYLLLTNISKGVGFGHPPPPLKIVGLMFNSTSSVTPSLLTNIPQGGGGGGALVTPLPLKKEGGGGGLLSYASEKGGLCQGGLMSVHRLDESSLRLGVFYKNLHNLCNPDLDSLDKPDFVKSNVLYT